MSINKETLMNIAHAICPDYKIVEHRNQLTIIVPIDFLLNLCYELRDNKETLFDMLIDVTAIDWNKRGERFEVVYNLYSNLNKFRVRIKVPVHEKQLKVPSVCEVWESANWYERETFDMYGIKFEGHPNLRRFYMPEDFVHPESGEPLYPLRKDFPLMGIPDALPLPPYPEKFGDVK